MIDSEGRELFRYVNHYPTCEGRGYSIWTAIVAAIGREAANVLPDLKEPEWNYNHSHANVTRLAPILTVDDVDIGTVYELGRSNQTLMTDKEAVDLDKCRARIRVYSSSGLSQYMGGVWVQCAKRKRPSASLQDICTVRGHIWSLSSTLPVITTRVWTRVLYDLRDGFPSCYR